MKKLMSESDSVDFSMPNWFRAGAAIVAIGVFFFIFLHSSRPHLSSSFVFLSTNMLF